MLELLETQGIASLQNILKLTAESELHQRKPSSIMSDANFKSAMIASILHEEKVEHPKLIELQNVSTMK